MEEPVEAPVEAPVAPVEAGGDPGNASNRAFSQTDGSRILPSPSPVMLHRLVPGPITPEGSTTPAPRMD